MHGAGLCPDATLGARGNVPGYRIRTDPTPGRRPTAGEGAMGRREGLPTVATTWPRPSTNVAPTHQVHCPAIATEPYWWQVNGRVASVGVIDRLEHF